MEARRKGQKRTRKAVRLRCTATAVSHARSDEMHTLRVHVPRTLMPACRRSGEVKHEIATPFTPCGQSRCVCSWLQCDSYACDVCSRLCCACGSQKRKMPNARAPPLEADAADAATAPQELLTVTSFADDANLSRYAGFPSGRRMLVPLRHAPRPDSYVCSAKSPHTPTRCVFRVL